MRQDDDVGRVEQISIDVVDDTNTVAVENPFVRRVEVGKADNDAIDGGDVSTLACPLKSLMNKVDDNAAFEKISPEGRDGNTLPDRISGDERASGFCVVNEVSGFFEPASHVVKVAVTGNAREDVCHVGLLSGRLKTLADKGRVANDEIGLRTNFFPISLQSVALVNIGVRF